MSIYSQYFDLLNFPCLETEVMSKFFNPINKIPKYLNTAFLRKDGHATS